MTVEQVRSFTYVLLGMMLGVIILALFIDVSHTVKKAGPSPEKKDAKESTDESNLTGTE